MNRQHFFRGCAVVIGLLSSAAYGQGTTEIIAMTGNAAPDGNGTFSFFSGAPVLNDGGADRVRGVPHRHQRRGQR